MIAVSMYEAKTNLSKYVSAVASKEEAYVVIMKNGIPAAKIVPYENTEQKRIGVAKGKLPALINLDEFNSIDVTSDFLGSGDIL